MTAYTEEVLHCINLDGSSHYDLPAKHIALNSNYDFFWRRSPAIVIYHAQNRVVTLPNDEMVLVGIDKNHCVSISLDQRGMPIEGYVNINLCPQRLPDGWYWKDLKLDIKLVINYLGEWSPILLDLEEFELASLSVQHRQLALDEVAYVMRQIVFSGFPFSTRVDPWFGFGPLNDLPE